MLTHINSHGYAKMVDVGEKDITKRTAIACATVKMSRDAMNLVKNGSEKKGDVIAVAQVAGIMGAKNTSFNIPMCHHISLSGCDLKFDIDEKECSIKIKSTCSTFAKTGVEMEALNSCTIAALTIYDMCKSADKKIRITDIHLMEKTGGKSGDFKTDTLEEEMYVESVNLSSEKGTVKTPVKSVECIKDYGIKGDAHAGNWHRQVSLLGIESIEKMENISGRKFSYGDFAENITTRGIELYKLDPGTLLKIGNCVLEITQIGKKCHNGCSIKKETGQCIMPTEGIFAKVIKEGIINIKDKIEII